MVSPAEVHYLAEVGLRWAGVGAFLAAGEPSSGEPVLTQDGVRVASGAKP